MDYEKGYVYELMDQGGPTDVREAYFKDAVDEMMRARTLCAKANACMPDDSTYVSYLEELFDRKLDDVRILTPFICDFGNTLNESLEPLRIAPIPVEENLFLLMKISEERTSTSKGEYYECR